jgi:hypothetical protein
LTFEAVEMSNKLGLPWRLAREQKQSTAASRAAFNLSEISLKSSGKDIMSSLPDRSNLK